MSYKRFFLFAIHFVLLFSLSAQTSPELPEGFFDERVGADWDRPIGITFDESGQAYVWEKKGRVMIIDKDGHKLDEPLVDIREEVLNWSDNGLVGFALDPSFQFNGYFYLYYAVDRHYLDFYGTPEYDPNLDIDHQATIGRITRYTADINNNFHTIIEGSRKIILGKDRSDGPAILLGSHGVGSLVFGTDGSLLVSLGDGGSYESTDTGNTPSSESSWEQAIEEGILRPEDNVGALKALQIQNENGSILRIDPETGLGLPSNPFYDPSAPNSPQSKIWLFGFRNPYRFIKLPETGSHFPEDANPGTLFIGDVGGSGWEELNVAIEGGTCFGWPMFEGIRHHWGFFHNPTANPYAPNPLDCEDGFFTFHDIVRDRNNIFQPPFTNPCDENQAIPSDIPTFVHTPPAITWSGLLWNPPPTTRVPSYNESSGWLEPLQIQDDPQANFKGNDFAGFTSIPGFIYDGNGFPEEFHGKYFHADLSGWIRIFHFNENYEFTEVDTFALWPDKGIVHMTYNAMEDAIYWCHVYENEIHKITFGSDPRPVADFEVDKQFGPGPLEVQFDASSSFDPDGGPITYQWDFGDGTTAEGLTPNHIFPAVSDSPYSYSVQLTVTDTSEQIDQMEMIISVNNTPPNIEITTFEDGEQYPISSQTYLPLRANVIDAEHKQGELTYKWETFLHHNNHYHPEEPDPNEETYAIIDPLGCNLETYWYRVRLTVTDASGLSAFDERELFPYCGEDFFEIIQLEAKIIDQKVVLNWITSFEEDMDKFEIQRTEDFKFEGIDAVDAIGTSIMNNPYHFTDQDPLKGDNYYRIKGINKSGEYLYSNIVYADFRNVKEASVYPNPTRGEVNILLNNAEEGIVDFALYHYSGQLILSRQWITTGGREELHFDMDENLPNGLYFYTIKNGATERSSSFVLKR